MLLLNRLTAACALGISLAIFGLAPSALAGQNDGAKALVQITDQEYCYSDAETFVVSLSLEVTVINLSSKSIYYRSDMTPIVGKVASSLKEARNGKFLYELSATIYPGPNQKPGRKIRVKPGRSVVLQSGYGVLASYDATATFPGTVQSGGAYALQLVLYPEMVPPKKERKRALRKELKSITPEPFLFQVPKEPTITSCK